ncbi:MAG TPA: hypothetical protein VK489_09910 [Ferruginibacter sp.]|nr:hypothetical protein [Ferruginibacter sp.]
MNRAILFLPPVFTWSGGIVAAMVAGIARTNTKMFRSQNGANY